MGEWWTTPQESQRRPSWSIPPHLQPVLCVPPFNDLPNLERHATTWSSSTLARNSFRFTAWIKSKLKGTFLSCKGTSTCLPEQSWYSRAISTSHGLLRPKQVHLMQSFRTLAAASWTIETHACRPIMNDQPLGHSHRYPILYHSNSQSPSTAS